MRKPLVLRTIPVLDFGGVESRIALQAEAAANRGYDFRICTYAEDGHAAARARRAGVQVDCLGTRASLRSLRPTLHMLRYLRRIGPEIVHSSIIESNVHTMAAASLAGIPVRIAEEVGLPVHSGRARLVMAAVYRMATDVVAVTRGARDYLVERDGAPVERVHQIYNCASPRFFPAKRRPTEQGAGPVRQLLAVGRLHQVKNHAALIEAFARVAPRHPDVTLTIVGDGPLRESLASQVATLGLNERVHFPGYKDDVVKDLTDADLYVIPSLTEGCSVSLVECLASGTPAIGSDVPGVREVLGNALSNRWAFNPKNPAAIADTLERFMSLTSGERAEIAVAGQNLAYQHFSPTAYLGRLDQLYASALRRANRGSLAQALEAGCA